MFGLTVHLALVGENNFASATRGVDGQSLLEALLNVRTPYSLRIGRGHILRTRFVIKKHNLFKNRNNVESINFPTVGKNRRRKHACTGHECFEN